MGKISTSRLYPLPYKDWRQNCQTKHLESMGRLPVRIWPRNHILVAQWLTHPILSDRKTETETKFFYLIPLTFLLYLPDRVFRDFVPGWTRTNNLPVLLFLCVCVSVFIYLPRIKNTKLDIFVEVKHHIPILHPGTSFH